MESDIMWPYTVQEADELKATSSCPRGELAARSVAMPADTNPNGEIFGGWIMAMMDSAGMMTATQHAQGRVTTVAVTDMTFHQPVKVGDVVCCYTNLVREGKNSRPLPYRGLGAARRARLARQGDRGRIHFCGARR